MGEKVSKFFLYKNTFIFLRLKQVVFRLFYFIRNELYGKRNYNFRADNFTSYKTYLKEFRTKYVSYKHFNNFIFVNCKKNFYDSIDWNFIDYGKLWTYNLAYFDYLHQPGMDRDTGLKLIHNFIESLETVREGIEPYPTSLRGINWIKFLSINKVYDERIDTALYSQYRHLLRNLEFHLLGNHLLENGFSLLFGAYYFRDRKFYKKARKILSSQLSEQILDDGGHFERSPMYHKIMLFRLLDCVNLLQHNQWIQDNLFQLLRSKAEAMLGYLQAISYRDGSTPHLNDSTAGIAPEVTELLEYGRRLGIAPRHTELGESGYRKIVHASYECIVDIAPIGPDYIPGHAHADTLSFELRLDGKPFIVDTGISTYEKNDRRQLERGTAAHNTVQIEDRDSSEVWGGFRVARRARVTNIEEDTDRIEATHNGYKPLGVYHTRRWTFAENVLAIEDTLNRAAHATARLHFHPSISEKHIRAHLRVEGQDYRINDYYYAEGFNRTRPAKVAEIDLTQYLKTEVVI